MMRPPIPDNEVDRIKTVRHLGLTDPEFVDVYDHVVELTQLATGLPICLFSIVDQERQFFKAGQGLGTRETPRDIAFCAWAIAQDRLQDIFHVQDAQGDARFADNPLVTGNPHIRFYAGVPVLAPDRMAVGTVCLIDREPGPLSDRVKRALRSAKALLEHALALRGQSIRDSLTGLFNRRFFDESVDREWRRSLRHQIPLSCLMIDIDHFKRYNDRYGHQAGDEALRRVAAALRGALTRGGDFVARYGGEEFVAVLPETDVFGAHRIAQRCIDSIRALEIAHEGVEAARVTVSVGGAVATSQTALGKGIAALIELADEHLYTAKREGRNRALVRQMPLDASEPVGPVQRAAGG